MNYTSIVEQFLKGKNKNFKFILNEVNNGVIIKIIENSGYTQLNRAVQGRHVNNIDRLVAHISYVLCNDDNLNYIYLSFIRVENNFKNNNMSKYIMAYFIGHLIEKYGQIPIRLENATNNTIKFNIKSCRTMRTQVRALSNKSNILLPRNSTLRSGKVRLNKHYWYNFGFRFKDDDPSEMEYTGKLTQLYDNIIGEIKRDLYYIGGNSYASVPNSGNAGNSGNSGNAGNAGNSGANLNNSANANNTNNANNANNTNNANVLNDGNNVSNNVNDKKYIKTKNGRRKIHIGKKGGKYYIMNKKKIYLK